MRETSGRVGEDGEEADRVSVQFQQFDANGDGIVERADLASVLRNLEPGKWSDGDVDAILTAFDKNGDGRIQYEEFIDWAFNAGSTDGRGKASGASSGLGR